MQYERNIQSLRVQWEREYAICENVGACTSHSAAPFLDVSASVELLHRACGDVAAALAGSTLPSADMCRACCADRYVAAGAAGYLRRVWRALLRYQGAGRPRETGLAVRLAPFIYAQPWSLSKSEPLGIALAVRRFPFSTWPLFRHPTLPASCLPVLEVFGK